MSELPAAAGRVDPPSVAAERPMLESWLDYHRATLLWKCAGLDDAQLRTRSVEPSTLSLHGLVRHMSEVERTWFGHVLDRQDTAPLYWSRSDPDGDFDGVDDADAATDLATFRETVEASREIAGRYALDDTGTHHGEPVSLRWIYVHMIEEYARHNGHADLLRERLDGATGD